MPLSPPRIPPTQGLFGVERVNDAKPTVAGNQVCLLSGLIFIMWFLAASRAFSVLLEPHRHRSPEEGRAEGEVADIDTRSNAGSDAVAIE